MPAIFREAPDVKEIANALIPDHHPDIEGHRIRVEYVFSDQVIEKRGKTRWGDCTKVSGKNAYLARPAAEQSFPPYTWTCTWCTRWGTDEFNRPTVHVEDEEYDVCHTCLMEAQDFADNRRDAPKVFKAKRSKADEKFENGPPDPPAFFVIVIYDAIWARLSDEQKKYLVDHELKHVGAEWNDDGESVLFIRSHDVEEFVDTMKWYGPHIAGDVNNIYAEMKKASEASQLVLFEDHPEVKAAAKKLKQLMVDAGATISIMAATD